MGKGWMRMGEGMEPVAGRLAGGKYRLLLEVKVGGSSQRHDPDLSVGLESVCITSDIVVININRGMCSKLSIMTLKKVGRYGNDPHKATCDQ